METRGPSRRAVVLVRNDVTTDARVRREVDALRTAGLEPLVVGVTTPDAPRTTGTVAGAPLMRLAVAVRRRPRPAATPAAPPPAPTPAPTPGGTARLRLSTRAGRLLSSLRFYRRAAGVVARRRPALLHCNDHNTMWVGVAARLLWRTPVVYDAHELWTDRNGRWEWRPWLVATEWLFTHVATSVITASPGYADVMARRYRIPRPTVIRNVPSRVATRSGPPPGDPPTMVYAGGLLAGRGLEDAIAALAELPGWRLRAVGPGAEATRARLRAQAAELGVADRLELADPVAPEELVDAISAGHVGLALIQPVSLSYELTLPNKLFEYVAAGLPVLATALPVLGAAVRELGVGEVVPPGDPAAIAAAARRLAGPEGDEARRRVHEVAPTLTWEAERSRLEAVYARAA